MDFEALLKQNHRMAHHNIRRKVFISISGLIICSIIGFIVVRPKQDPTFQKRPEKINSRLEQGAAGNSTTEDSITIQAPATKGPITNQKPVSAKMLSDKKQKVVPTIQEPVSGETSDKVSQPFYVQAEPREGYPLLYGYFEESLVYPGQAVKDSVEGVVNVMFSINADGKAENITIENSLGPLFDEEVIRLLNNMPLWNPATYNRKVVKSKISLPIEFDLDKTNLNK